MSELEDVFAEARTLEALEALERTWRIDHCYGPDHLPYARLCARISALQIKEQGHITLHRPMRERKEN